MNVTLSSYLQEIIALTEKYAVEMEMPDCDAAKMCEEMMDGNFKRTLNHIVECDFVLTSGVPINDNTIKYTTKDCTFTINTLNMRFNINSAVEFDKTLALNEIAANEQVATALKRLTAIISEGAGDLFDYATSKVYYLTVVLAAGKAKCDELQAIIDVQQQEQAQPAPAPAPPMPMPMPVTSTTGDN